jgi:23S rRNA (cytosine1962-C5)-methyltransferase
MSSELAALIEPAIAARSSLFDDRHEGALRLFNGFTEGLPVLALDVYAKTLLLHDYSAGEQGDEALAREALEVVRRHLPWLSCAVWKVRHSKSQDLRNGSYLLGGEPQLARKVKEAGVWYALAPTLNRDGSFYVDTRELRAWALAHLAGKRVLNTFAYTGSLGVAARAAGAEVVHTDLNRRFLNVAKDSYSLNGWPIRKADFKTGDYFEIAGQLKREGQLFDCVFVDPPFFSVTGKGRVDLEGSVERLLNKARPLLGDGGFLVAVNNAVFQTGADFLKALEHLCADGYLSLERQVAIPEDTAGFAGARRGGLPVDPAPFNHSTKIVILRNRRKDGRTAQQQRKDADVPDAASAFSGD